MGGVAAIVGAIVAVAGAATSGVQQANAADDAKKAQAKQDEERKKALREVENRKKIKDATVARDLNSQRLKQKAGEKAGRSGTIVSGPLGVPSANAQSGTAKTAIGE